ncbi:hypothetical protein GCM10029992_43160 [Glycomyces albus]
MYGMIRSLFYGDMGDMAEMGRELVASAAEFRRSGDRWGRASALSYAALASTATGDYRTGIQQIEEAIEVAAELGSDAYHRVTLSMIRVAAGETERAREELTALVGATAGLPAVLGRRRSPRSPGTPETSARPPSASIARRPTPQPTRSSRPWPWTDPPASSPRPGD